MFTLICTAHSVCLCCHPARGAADIRGQAEGRRGEHAGSSWAGESTDPLHRMPAGLHRAGERPRLLELSAAGQVSRNQVSKGTPFLEPGITIIHLSVFSSPHIFRLDPVLFIHFELISFKSPFSKLSFSFAELLVSPPSQSIWFCRSRNSHLELTGCRRS